MGRQGIYEVLVNSREVQAQITRNWITANRKSSMAEVCAPSRLSGATQLHGETAIEEVMRVFG
jgi:type II secretory ATPase GspE/PulE/Tfp pilus assembly ATPase PilB-like protein